MRPARRIKPKQKNTVVVISKTGKVYSRGIYILKEKPLKIEVVSKKGKKYSIYHHPIKIEANE